MALNKIFLCGRLVKAPEVRYSNEMAIARYTLAVDRKGKKDEADFISCVAFGKNGEFAEKYLNKGIKVIVEGHIQTGSYEKDGRKVYTTDVVVDGQEFAESKGNTTNVEKPTQTDSDGFMNIPEDIDEDLPFGAPVR